MAEENTRKCPKCGFEQSTDRRECVRCRLVFSEFAYPCRVAGSGAAEPGALPLPGRERRGRWTRFVDDYLLAQPDDLSLLYVVGRGLVLVLLLVWGIGFIRTPIAYGEINESFMHWINLVFHEAGHVIFALFGDFMGVLGGSLGQLIIPLMCFTALFLKYQNAFGGAVTLWWIGESLLDIAPYIYDARFMELLLLGGHTGQDAPETHDWHNILGRLGWLEKDHSLAQWTYRIGTVLIIVALVWGATLLWRQVAQLRKES